MSQPVTIVMYHFVRDLPRTRYPAIKGLTTANFIGQLDYLQHHHRLVTMEDCLRAVRGEMPLPEKAALLTFDDGYLDHYLTVFPLLDQRGLQGSFFPPARAITQRVVLDVNKIHFILAAAPLREVMRYLQGAVEDRRAAWDLRTLAEYREELHHPNRFDPAEVIFIKRMLQHALPEGLRAEITNELFARYVTADEAAFAGELYMDAEQLRCLVRHGMYVGSHGFEHYWMNTITPEQQAREVALSLDFLDTLGAPTRDWTMCYPYGAHNPGLLKVVHQHHGALGLTSERRVAELAPEHALTLPRLDTNDLPHAAAEAA